MEITINSNVFFGTIFAVIVMVLSLIGFFLDSNEKFLTISSYGFLFAFGIIGLASIWIGNSISYSEGIVYLNPIPNSTEYCIYLKEDNGFSLQYMDGNKLLNDKVSDLEIIYDAKDKPYMEIEEGKNIINKTIEKNVIIHMIEEDK